MPDRLSLSKFDAVLFDVDGTLVDSLDMILRGLGDTVERYLGHRPAPTEIRKLVGMPLRLQFEILLGTEPTPEKLVEMTEFTLERYEAYSEHETLFAQAVETLRLCHKCGLKTALVTSKNATELQNFLPRFPGTPYLNATVCASDVHHPKPDPESAVLACQKLGVDPSKAVMIGDSIYDMRCARGAGVACVAVAYGAAFRETLLEENPDMLVDTPEELFAWAESAFLQTPCPERN
jgi:pyrophosphatase PpaX